MQFDKDFEDKVVTVPDAEVDAHLASVQLMHAAGDYIYATARGELQKRGQDFACRGSGCFGCCRAGVSVTQREAEVLAGLATDDQVERMVKHAENFAEDASAQVMWCPFLDLPNGRCTVYRARPLVCRTYHSMAEEADDCWPERVGLKEIPSLEPVFVYTVAIQVGAVKRGEEVGLMVPMILKELGK